MVHYHLVNSGNVWIMFHVSVWMVAKDMLQIKI